jgi:hypothetical protein
MSRFMVIKRPGAGEVKPRFRVSRGGPVGYLESGSGHEEMKRQHAPQG